MRSERVKLPPPPPPAGYASGEDPFIELWEHKMEMQSLKERLTHTELWIEGHKQVKGRHDIYIGIAIGLAILACIIAF